MPPLGEQISYNELTEQNSFGYDAVGNRINETNKTQTKTVTISNTVNGVSRQEQTSTSPEQATTVTYNDLNELTQLNEPNGISTFEYDLNGNLKEIRKNNTIISKYEYDIRNQLTKAKDGLDNEIARFDYDFERKRTVKTNSLGTQIKSLIAFRNFMFCIVIVKSYISGSNRLFQKRCISNIF